MKVSFIVEKSIRELKSITKIDMCVISLKGECVATTDIELKVDIEIFESFILSPADSQMVGILHLLKIYSDEDLQYILVARNNHEDAYMVGKIAVSQISNILIAFKDKVDINNFYQNLLLDNMLLIDMYNKAKKLNIEINKKRIVFLIEMQEEKESLVKDLLKGIFSNKHGNYITSIDENSIVILKEVELDITNTEFIEMAEIIVSMVNTEVMLNVKVAYGTIVEELKDVSKSFKEAKVALEVGKIFYEANNVIGYNMLGIGRLIYQLPNKLCRVFLKEIFGTIELMELDEEMFHTVDKFFENDLNVAETSRQLFVHRNTLGNRIDRLQDKTGLDIRKFDHALTLKIALMVTSYIKYLDLKE